MSVYSQDSFKKYVLRNTMFKQKYAECKSLPLKNWDEEINVFELKLKLEEKKKDLLWISFSFIGDCVGSCHKRPQTRSLQHIDD